MINKSIFNSGTRGGVILASLLYAILCWIAARYILKGFGDSINDTKIAAITFILIFLCSAKKTYWILVLPVSVLALLYSPIAAVYGQPDFQSLISAFSTNWEESIEFLTLIPLKFFYKAPLCVLFSFFAYLIAKNFNLRPWKNKTIIVFSVVILGLLSRPTEFFSRLSSGFELTKNEIEILEGIAGKPTWGTSTSIGTTKDYVLIIGESARRDYFQVYGYPVKDTPFLSSVPSTIVEGLTSGDTFTIGSLRLMLTQANATDWTPRYDRNIVDLANSAGIQTVWLSNQGFIGHADTPISSIAFHANIVKFPTKFSYSKNTLSDYHLLPQLNEVLNMEARGSRFIVLHTMGSHSDTCRRVFDVPDRYQAIDDKYSEIACYISSIKKTDRFIERVYNLLQEKLQSTGRPFSIIYFSDHGLCARDVDGKIIIDNNVVSKYHYDIPLVKIDSNGISTKYLKSKKSALRFTEGLAYWMGIKNQNLRAYNLFDGISDATDYGLKERREKRNPLDDTPIDMTNLIKK